MKKTLKVRVEARMARPNDAHSHIEVTCKTWLGKDVNTPLTYCVGDDVFTHAEILEGIITTSEIFANANRMEFKLEMV